MQPGGYLQPTSSKRKLELAGSSRKVVEFLPHCKTSYTGRGILLLSYRRQTIDCHVHTAKSSKLILKIKGFLWPLIYHEFVNNFHLKVGLISLYFKPTIKLSELTFLKHYHNFCPTRPWGGSHGHITIQANVLCGGEQIVLGVYQEIKGRDSVDGIAPHYRPECTVFESW